MWTRASSTAMASTRHSVPQCQSAPLFAGVGITRRDATHTGPGGNKAVFMQRDRGGPTSGVGLSPLWPVGLVPQPTQGSDLHAPLLGCRQRTPLPPCWEEIQWRDWPGAT